MIDLIHDVAEGYRKVVFASSYPGDIQSISDHVVNNTISPSLSSHMILFVYMLLDAEVTYCVMGDDKGEVTSLIGHLTYSKCVRVDEADFIFVLKEASIEDKISAIENSKVGTLVDPHLSATIVFEVSSVRQGLAYTLSGPGIEHSKEIYVDVFEGWEVIRNKKNKEFPLGIELYFTDKQGDILVLPRTTHVIQGGM